MSAIFIDSMRYSANQLKSDLYFVLEEFESVFLKLVDEGEAIISSNYDLEKCKNYLLNDSFIGYYYDVLLDFYRDNPTDNTIVNHILLAMTRIKSVCNFCRAGIQFKHKSLDIGEFEDLYKRSSQFVTVIASQAYKEIIKGVNLTTPVYNDQSVLTSMREYERKLYDLPTRRCKSKL